MKKLSIVFILLAGVIIYSCAGRGSEKKFTGKKPPKKDPYAALYSQAEKMFQALPDEMPADFNPITLEKVALGKKLYFDNRLSKDNTQSCNSCHNLNTFGVDNLSFSPGNNGGLGGRNSPTTLNAALHMAQFWDGREPHVEAQAGGPILNPVEMEMPSEQSVIERLKAIPEYVEMFAAAYPGESNPITYKNLRFAIGAFERKLVTPTRFDEFLKGKTDKLTDAEKKGLQTFLDAGCATCHAGVTLGGDQYQKFGVHVDYWSLTKSEKKDEGRFEVTKDEADKYVFKVPSLRNVEKTYPYFHDGSVQDLKEAVRIMAKAQLNKDLTEAEINSIVIFLKTLTGDVAEEYKK
ncbi:MAG: cytochrome-c peroxidase [Crocinitomicaceae bacterium]